MASPLARLRKLCLAFPEAHEVEAWGAPTFRVRNKLFAMYAAPDDHHGGGRPGIWIKSTHVNQDLMLQSDGDRFFFPPYVGPSGWIGVYLDASPDWQIVAEILRDGYVLTAPRRVAALLDRPATAASGRTGSGRTGSGKTASGKPKARPKRR